MSKELTHRADELASLGWSAEDVNRYAELWDYRQRWGAMNLEREDRLFLRKAEAALPELVTGKSAAKKNTKDKSYYRWLTFHLDAMTASEAQMSIPDGARGAWPILPLPEYTQEKFPAMTLPAKPRAPLTLSRRKKSQHLKARIKI